MSKYRGGIGPAGAQGLAALRGRASSIVSIQYALAVLGTGTSANAALSTPVIPANCVLLYLGCRDNYTATHVYTDAYVSAFTATAVTFSRVGNLGGTETICTCGVCVIEFAPGVIKSNQLKTVSVTGTNSTGTVTIDPVDVAKTLVSYLGKTAGADAADVGQGDVGLTNSTTITGTRSQNGSSATLTMGCQAVEFF